MEFEAMLTPREKSPLPKMSPEEDRTRDAVDSEPKHYQRAIVAPDFFPLLYDDRNLSALQIEYQCGWLWLNPRSQLYEKSKTSESIVLQI